MLLSKLKKRITKDIGINDVEGLFRAIKRNGGSMHYRESKLSPSEFFRLGNWMDDHSGHRVQCNRMLENIVIDGNLDWNGFVEVVKRYS